MSDERIAKQFPTSPLGEQDAGVAGRREPCILRTWCVLELDHDGSCVELPRYEIASAGFGPRKDRP